MSQFANLGVLCCRAAARPVVVRRGMVRSVVSARRGMATATPAAEEDGKLPLKGVRVLDMTRVLAGVYMSLSHTCDTANAD